jgi:hypothetical protein
MMQHIDVLYRLCTELKGRRKHGDGEAESTVTRRHADPKISY